MSTDGSGKHLRSGIERLIWAVVRHTAWALLLVPLYIVPTEVLSHEDGWSVMALLEAVFWAPVLLLGMLPAGILQFLAVGDADPRRRVRRTTLARTMLRYGVNSLVLVTCLSPPLAKFLYGPPAPNSPGWPSPPLFDPHLWRLMETAALSIVAAPILIVAIIEWGSANADLLKARLARTRGPN